MANILPTRFTMKKDTEDNWERNNPVLLDGEVGIIEEDGCNCNTIDIVVGDGKSRYKELTSLKDPLYCEIDYLKGVIERLIIVSSIEIGAILYLILQ